MTALKQKRKKKLIMLSSIIVVMIALIVVKVVVDKADSKQTDEEVLSDSTITGDFMLVDANANDFVKFEYKIGDRLLAFEKQDNNWIYMTDKELPVDTTKVENQFLSTFADLSSQRKIKDGADRLKDFGLDNPTAKIIATTNNNEKYTLSIGNYNNMISLYYVYVEELNEVYLVEDTIYTVCREDVYDFAVTEEYPSFAVSDVIGVNIKNDDMIVEIAYFKDRLSTDLTNSTAWYIGLPFDDYVGCEKNKMEDGIELFAGLEYLKTVAYKPTQEDLVTYGIKDSTKAYTVKYTEKVENSDGAKDTYTFKLTIGKLNNAGDYYYVQPSLYRELQKLSDGYISLMSKATVDAMIGLDPIDYIFTYSAYVKLDDILDSSCVITKDNKDYELTYTKVKIDEKEDDVLKLDGHLVDEDKLKNFYAELIKLGADRIVYDKSTLKETNPVYTVKFNRIVEDAVGDITVKYTRYDASYYQIEINGVTQFLTLRRDVDKTMNMIDDVLATATD